jgi:hypothetical protein
MEHAPQQKEAASVGGLNPREAALTWSPQPMLGRPAIVEPIRAYTVS